MVYLGIIALVTLLANSATRLRLIAVTFVGIALVAGFIASPTATIPQAALTASAGFAAAGILFIAAGDGRAGRAHRVGRSRGSGHPVHRGR